MTTTDSQAEELTSEEILILESLLSVELTRRQRGMGSINLDGHDRMAVEPFVRLRSKLRRFEDTASEAPSHIDRPL